MGARPPVPPGSYVHACIDIKEHVVAPAIISQFLLNELVLYHSGAVGISSTCSTYENMSGFLIPSGKVIQEYFRAISIFFGLLSGPSWENLTLFDKKDLI